LIQISNPSSSASPASTTPVPSPTSPAPKPNSRRARLARLREETEPLVAEERRAGLRALLQQP